MVENIKIDILHFEICWETAEKCGLIYLCIMPRLGPDWHDALYLWIHQEYGSKSLKNGTGMVGNLEIDILHVEICQ